MKLKIEYVKLSEIRPANYNPRDISNKALGGLVESIRNFDMVEPLIINTRTNTLVGGHQRLKACEILGKEMIPVVYVDLDTTEEKALNVVLNSQKISGHFTDDLDNLLLEIKASLDPQMFEDLLLPEMEGLVQWESDLGAIEKIDENLDGLDARIIITCREDLKDEVLIYIKAKLMETSFQGVHVK